MIGRFLGTEVPAAGFSLGFERLVELVDLPDDKAANAIALVYDADVPAAQLAALKSHLIATGVRTTLARKTKNTTALLDQLASTGYPRFAFVDASTVSADQLEIRNIGAQ
jgi:histidyl-tRNA synthetase